MARFTIDEYFDIHTSSDITSASWRVALDEDFEYVIDSVEDSVESRIEWCTPLPKINGGINEFYDSLDTMYVEVKIKIDNIWSKPYVKVFNNQAEQEVTFTDNGTVIKTGDEI